MLLSKSNLKIITILVTLLFGIFSYQNCSRLSQFTKTQGEITSSSFSSDSNQIQTKLNTSVTFSIDHEKSLDGMSFVFRNADNNVSAIKGTITVLDAANFKFQFTPEFGFRGSQNIEVIISDVYGNKKSVFLNIYVGNALQDLQPALAIRGMGCIQCHANISANVLTDFGYGSDYYFSIKPNAGWWNSGGIYGDHGNNFNTIVMSDDKKLFVPKAALPTNVSAAISLETLAQYIQSQFVKSTTESTTKVQIVEKSSIYIGAPKDSDIELAFQVNASIRSQYFKDSDNSQELTGLVDKKSYFKISGDLSCDGDLFIRGPLYINNINLNTISGCRIYVIGSVFMYGPLNFKSSSENRNLQISSSRSISLGLGNVKNGNTFCEPNSRFATENATYGNSSLAVRYTNFWTVPSYYTRQSSDPQAFGKSVVAESALIESGEGQLQDASCRIEGRQVSFDRLLLNAPVVHSRYEGNFSGSIIAEYSIMSLGAFTFTFNDVFKENTILPFLNSNIYLSVK